jgi:transposase-like protein
MSQQGLRFNLLWSHAAEGLGIAVQDPFADGLVVVCDQRESLGSELKPTEVARKYAISNGLLYAWRQQVLGGQVGVVSGATPSFARVELAPRLQAPDGREPSAPAVSAPARSPSSGRDGVIEIVLPKGTLVRVDAGVDGRALRRVLSALDD